jgi:hypothetical protein
VHNTKFYTNTNFSTTKFIFIAKACFRQGISGQFFVSFLIGQLKKDLTLKDPHSFTQQQSHISRRCGLKNV